MKIGVFYDHIVNAASQSGRTVLECMKAFRACGVDGVEFDYDSLKDEDEYATIKLLLEQSALSVSGVYFVRDLNTETGMEDVPDLLTKVSELKGTQILVVPGFLNETEAVKLESLCESKELTAKWMDENPQIQVICEKLTQIVQMAQPYGIHITLEDYDLNTSPCARMYELCYFMESVPGLSYTFDMGNFAYSNEDACKAYELLKAYVVHVHCKDRGVEQQIVDQKLLYKKGLASLPVGTGYLPIGEMIEQLKQDGYQGYLTMEHFGMQGQYEGILASTGFLKCF